ncbi:MAG: hypothetical protein ACLS9T_05845 [Streptococcus salivarius]
MEEWEWLKSEFSKDNLTAPENYVVENTNGKLENGYLTSSLRMGISGAAIVFIPKGVTLPTVQGFVDGSDNTKDRILITQSASPQSDAKQFYYKADDYRRLGIQEVESPSKKVIVIT